MTTSPTWLIDKSAFSRLGAAANAHVWVERIQRGLVRIATPTLLEIGYSARSPQDWETLMTRPPISLMPVEGATPLIEARAHEIQGVLTRRGQHRGPSVPDLLIAATAELCGHVVLHCDKDFDLIAAVTGQPLERLDLEVA